MQRNLRRPSGLGNRRGNPKLNSTLRNGVDGSEHGYKTSGGAVWIMEHSVQRAPFLSFRFTEPYQSSGSNDGATEMNDLRVSARR